MRRLRHAWILVLLAAGGCAAGSRLQRHEFTRLQMGVEARIVLYAPADQRETASAAAGEAFAAIAKLEQIVSDYRPSSELMRFCARAGEGPVKVSDDLFAILLTAQMLSEASGGGFDVTIGPLSRLWRDARQKGHLPSETEITDARRLVNWRHVVLDRREQTVELRVKGMSLDLGGIAKGYAAERGVRVLRERGFARCLVALAGDIAAGDPPPNAEGWKIAIAPRNDDDDNRRDDQQSRHVLLANACVSTSGDAEQFIEIAGMRHSHIIDPRTGYGVTHPINVTVIAQRGEIADGLASAISVIGEQGLGLGQTFHAATIMQRPTSNSPSSEIVDPHRLIRWSD